MANKPFKYKLQSILNIKEKIEEEEKEKLSKLLFEKANEEAVLQHLKDRKFQSQEEMKAKQLQGAMDMEELKRYEAHLKKMEFLIQNQVLRIRELDMKIEQQRQVVIKATQERKMFDKLKEKHKDRFMVEQDREERKFIDELAISRFQRDKGEKQEMLGGDSNGNL